VTKFKPNVEIVESYKDYDPPVNATAVTRKLIDNIPQKYLLGLGQIVITNHSALPRRVLRQKVRSRKRKISRDKVRGFYHYRTGSSRAWIEIYIDQISDLKDGIFQRVPFFREKAFSEVLYHEIGHHIHSVVHPEHRELEDVAEEWEARLWSHYCVKKYWYLKPLFRLASKISRSKVYQRFYQRLLIKRQNEVLSGWGIFLSMLFAMALASIIGPLILPWIGVPADVVESRVEYSLVELLITISLGVGFFRMFERVLRRLDK